MIHRIVALLGLLAGLSACSVEAPLESDLADSIRVQSVEVVVTGGESTLEHYGYTKAMLKRDLTAALTKELKAGSANGTRPVKVQFDVSHVSFDSVLPGALRTYPYSQISADVTVVDARTGAAILSDKTMSGNDNLGKHDLESSTKAVFSLGKQPGVVYHDLVQGFAADIRRQLFEWEGMMTMVH